MTMRESLGSRADRQPSPLTLQRSKQASERASQPEEAAFPTFLQNGTNQAKRKPADRQSLSHLRLKNDTHTPMKSQRGSHDRQHEDGAPISTLQIRKLV